MENISNDKIEKARADRARYKAELAKTKARTAELYAKIREVDKLLEMLEAFEIAARYRELIGNEDFSAQLKISQNKATTADITDSAAEQEELNVNFQSE
ncbi:MAG: hypothetical protein LBN97_09180 [Oscillospiraceae bacterium]|jgi:hypothetical protein|nr:hypothetical protein [Oscillospiraceae bacterium]